MPKVKKPIGYLALYDTFGKEITAKWYSRKIIHFKKFSNKEQVGFISTKAAKFPISKESYPIAIRFWSLFDSKGKIHTLMGDNPMPVLRHEYGPYTVLPGDRFIFADITFQMDLQAARLAKYMVACGV